MSIGLRLLLQRMALNWRRQLSIREGFTSQRIRVLHGITRVRQVKNGTLLPPRQTEPGWWRRLTMMAFIPIPGPVGMNVGHPSRLGIRSLLRRMEPNWWLGARVAPFSFPPIRAPHGHRTAYPVMSPVMSFGFRLLHQRMEPD